MAGTARPSQTGPGRTRIAAREPSDLVVNEFVPHPEPARHPPLPAKSRSTCTYELEAKVATREAYGDARQGGGPGSEVVAVDGDTKNSTYAGKVLKAHPKRFFEMFIAEQNMVGAATGLAARGKNPVCLDVCRISDTGVRSDPDGRRFAVEREIRGSHAGVSIGEDGPSQMALEDLASLRAIHGSVVLYPSDATATVALVEVMANTPGTVYRRATAAPTRLFSTRRGKGSMSAAPRSCGQVTLIRSPWSGPG